jgi:hypothetical protein
VIVIVEQESYDDSPAGLDCGVGVIVAGDATVVKGGTSAGDATVVEGGASAVGGVASCVVASDVVTDGVILTVSTAVPEQDSPVNVVPSETVVYDEHSVASS